MMRSLYSGISGLRNHQTRMDVIGNNIANVNTIGYKTSRVVFQDVFSQTSSAGSANQAALGGMGGTNPLQIGLGMKLSTVDVIHTGAPIQRTDNPFDLMVNGDGMFIVQGPEGPFYTRAGNFYLDDEGYLVTSHGYYVLAWTTEDQRAYMNLREPNTTATPPIDGDYDITFNETDLVPPPFDADEPVLSRIRLKAAEMSIASGDPVDLEEDSELVGFSVGSKGEITVLINNIKTQIGTLGIAVFSNYTGLEKAGNSLYRQSLPSGNAILTGALQEGAGDFTGGGLEMSNVDLANEFTDMIVTQRGFQANSRIITVSDTMLEELVNLKR